MSTHLQNQTTRQNLRLVDHSPLHFLPVPANFIGGAIHVRVKAEGAPEQGVKRPGGSAEVTAELWTGAQIRGTV